MSLPSPVCSFWHFMESCVRIYPDIYQAVLRECGVEGRNALAVEDTDTGMRAAVSAGIPCLGYRNPTSGNQKLDMGCTVIEKMMEIPAFLQEI